MLSLRDENPSGAGGRPQSQALMRQSMLLFVYYRKGEGETQLLGYQELFDVGD
jgi:hypothetical protein